MLSKRFSYFSPCPDTRSIGPVPFAFRRAQLLQNSTRQNRRRHLTPKLPHASTQPLPRLSPECSARRLRPATLQWHEKFVQLAGASCSQVEVVA